MDARTRKPIPLLLSLVIALVSAVTALAFAGGHDAAAHGAPDRREQILVFVETGGGQRLVLGLLADDVDHVIDRDAAEQDVAVVDDRRRHPVVVGELARDLFGGFGDVDRI